MRILVAGVFLMLVALACGASPRESDIIAQTAEAVTPTDTSTLTDTPEPSETPVPTNTP
jgi:hypothetical protein